MERVSLGGGTHLWVDQFQGLPYLKIRTLDFISGDRGEFTRDGVNLNGMEVMGLASQFSMRSRWWNRSVHNMTIGSRGMSVHYMSGVLTPKSEGRDRWRRLVFTGESMPFILKNGEISIFIEHFERAFRIVRELMPNAHEGEDMNAYIPEKCAPEPPPRHVNARSTSKRPKPFNSNSVWLPSTVADELISELDACTTPVVPPADVTRQCPKLPPRHAAHSWVHSPALKPPGRQRSFVDLIGDVAKEGEDMTPSAYGEDLKPHERRRPSEANQFSDADDDALVAAVAMMRPHTTGLIFFVLIAF